jgi:prolycopene isomerase
MRPSVRETIVTDRFAFAIPSSPEEIRGAFAARFPEQRPGLARFFALLSGESVAQPPATLAAILASCGVVGDCAFLIEALLGNLGLPAHRVDGPTALAFFREFLLDGGYYPVGGMGSLVETLAERIRAIGGTVRTGCAAAAFAGTGDTVEAVRFHDGSECRAEAFVSAMSARTTYAMAPATGAAIERQRELGRLSLAPSAFMVFLGLGRRLDELTPHAGHILSLPEARMDAVYRTLDDDRLLLAREGYVYVIAPSRLDASAAPPGGESICLFVLAPWRSRAFWESRRREMADALVARAERVIPGLSSCIRVAESSTPGTIERWTGNDAGAIYGWEAVPGQGGAARLSPLTPWGNLFLAGHWTRPGSGISAAASSGHLAARTVRRHLAE